MKLLGRLLAWIWRGLKRLREFDAEMARRADEDWNKDRAHGDYTNHPERRSRDAD